jgi:hypothetical protein
MTKKEMKEIYNKAFDLLLEMQEEYYRYSGALLNQDDVTAEDASIKFEMYLKELKELGNEKSNQV